MFSLAIKNAILVILIILILHFLIINKLVSSSQLVKENMTVCQETQVANDKSLRAFPLQQIDISSDSTDEEELYNFIKRERNKTSINVGSNTWQDGTSTDFSKFAPV